MATGGIADLHVKRVFGVCFEMTSSESLGRSELLELAPLEALGLLDDIEERRFDIGYSEASTAIQSEVQDLQAAVAAEFGSASKDGPDRSLRYRVLASLSAAIDADDTACAPIAAIGDPTAYRRSPNQTTTELHADAVANAVRVDRAARSAMLWRAAALTFGCGLLVVLFFANNLAQTTRDLAHLALSNEVRLELRERVGFTYLSYLDSSTAEVVALGGTTGDGAGVLFIEVKNNSGLFVAFDLPESEGPFTLVAVDPTSGVRTQLATVANAGQFAAMEFALSNQTAGSVFEVLNAEGDVVLRTSVA